MSKFIYTSDKETANELKKFGFKIIKSNSDRFMFINDDKIKMNFEKLKNVGYTNILTF